MRIPVSRSSEETGAIAVLVVLTTSLVLLGMAAFSADLGLAYAGSRRAQTAADAAAIAAGRELGQALGRCADVEAAATFAADRAEAEQAANEVRAANLGRDTIVPLTGSGEITDIDCRADRFLEVTVTAASSTEPVFAGLLGRDAPIESLHTATAEVEVAESAKRVRPHFLCGYRWNGAGNYAPSWSTESDVSMATIVFPDDATSTSPPCPAPPGAAGDWEDGWWSIQCPGPSGAPDSKTLGTATREGCPDAMEIVPSQPGPGSEPPYAGYSSDLSAHLRNACNPLAKLPSCLSASDARVSDADVTSEWPGLLGQTIILPVFCAQTACNPTAVEPQLPPTFASGALSNAEYPVWHLAAVTVCAYKWGDPSTNPDLRGSVFDSISGSAPAACENAPPDESVEQYLQIAPATVVTTGERNTTCLFGRPCDGGVRTVRLIE